MVIDVTDFESGIYILNKRSHMGTKRFRFI